MASRLAGPYAYVSQFLMKIHVSFQDHLYQPLFTLVGAGIRNVHESERPMSQVLPKQCVHIQQKVVEFDPEASQVTLKNGEVVCDFVL